MDMIAIPDFSAGAMENWGETIHTFQILMQIHQFFFQFLFQGLITYRETALLYQPNVSTSSSQSYVASVVAHELAHQWFGNLGE